ncbi:MAG: HlyC/CorC family transporter [Magnetococcales bacterium]|nr:HlyC/CorC family transporter [Magnetococcales bacterium]MBF0156194.1 HlyC/CorC family transporter [Magnetococcales bacterium]
MELLLPVKLFLFVLLLACSAFFSGSETALFSLNRHQLEQMELSGHPRIQLIRRLLNDPRLLIVAVLVGNELVNVSASVISASIVLSHFGSEDVFWVNLLIMLPVLLIVGEVTPKTVAVKNNMAFATVISRPLSLIISFMSPVLRLVRGVADRLTTLLVGDHYRKGREVTEDMVRTLAHQATEEGDLGGLEREFINNIFDFGNQTVEEVQTPRARIFSLSLNTPLPELLKALQEAPFTRIPVYRGTDRDAIVGVIHLRDILNPDFDGSQLTAAGLEKLTRPPLFVPETKPLLDLFHLFRQRKLSFALALDEFGSITGLVTMEDLLRSIFGQLGPDPVIHRPTDPLLGRGGVVKLDGALPVSHFNQRAGAELPLDVAETLGGLLLHRFGELPSVGRSLTLDKWRFTVVELVGNRIQTVACVLDSRAGGGGGPPGKLPPGVSVGEKPVDALSAGELPGEMAVGHAEEVLARQAGEDLAGNWGDDLSEAGESTGTVTVAGDEVEGEATGDSAVAGNVAGGVSPVEGGQLAASIQDSCPQGSPEAGVSEGLKGEPGRRRRLPPKEGS